MQLRQSRITACAGTICALFLLVWATALPSKAMTVSAQVRTQLLVLTSPTLQAECHRHSQPTCPSKTQCKHALRAPDVRAQSARTKRKVAAYQIIQAGLTSHGFARPVVDTIIVGVPYVFRHPGTPFKTVFASTMRMLN